MSSLAKFIANSTQMNKMPTESTVTPPPTILSQQEIEKVKKIHMLNDLLDENSGNESEKDTNLPKSSQESKESSKSKEKKKSKATKEPKETKETEEQTTEEPKESNEQKLKKRKYTKKSEKKDGESANISDEPQQTESKEVKDTPAKTEKRKYTKKAKPTIVESEKSDAPLITVLENPITVIEHPLTVNIQSVDYNKEMFVESLPEIHPENKLEITSSQELDTIGSGPNSATATPTKKEKRKYTKKTSTENQEKTNTDNTDNQKAKPEKRKYTRKVSTNEKVVAQEPVYTSTTEQQEPVNSLTEQETVHMQTDTESEKIADQIIHDFIHDKIVEESTSSQNLPSLQPNKKQEDAGDKKLKSKFEGMVNLGQFNTFDQKYQKITCNNDIFLYTCPEMTTVIRGPMPYDYIKDMNKFKHKWNQCHPTHHMHLEKYYANKNNVEKTGEEYYLVYSKTAGWENFLR